MSNSAVSTIAVFNIVVSGFGEDRGDYHGTLNLREKLIAAGHGCGLDNRVWYVPWTVNVNQLVHDLHNVCMVHKLRPLINIAGYSYGGWAALRIADQLGFRGYLTHHLTLCDPVARPHWLPQPIPALSSLLGRRFSRRLKVPITVLNLYGFYQLQNRPQGHRLHVTANTNVVYSTQLNKMHSEMDDTSEFHDSVLEHADTLTKQLGD